MEPGHKQGQNNQITVLMVFHMMEWDLSVDVFLDPAIGLIFSNFITSEIILLNIQPQLVERPTWLRI